MLPGLDGTGKLFEAFISCLSLELNPIVCSYPEDDSIGYRELVDFVYDQCPLNEPYLILGESFSGPIAIDIGARKPQNLKGVVLVNTFVACPRPLLTKLVRILPDRLLTKPPRLILNKLLQEKEIGAEPFGALYAVLRSLPSSLIRSRLASIETVDVHTIAMEIETPVCVVQSECDIAVPVRARKFLLDALAMPETHNLKGNHFGLQTHPKEVSRIIVEFHRKLAS